MTHLVIRRYRPYQIVALVLAISLIFSTTVWFMLDESHWAFIKSRVTLGQESKRLWNENRGLEADNNRLRERIIMLERMTQIDSQAAAELHEEMKELQDEVYRLQEELEFYQAIITSTGSSEGLSIQGMQVERLPEANNYNFKLILTHVTKSDKVTEGVIEMTLEGLQDGVARVLNITEVVLNPAIDLSFNFKNFKRIEGNMVLPEGFMPHRVIVRLQPKDTKLSKIKRVFDWSAMAG